MSVIEYRDGDHGAGFIGFRVATTLGKDGEYRQKYFSIKKMPYDDAKREAESLDRRWREEAKKRMSEYRLSSRRKGLGSGSIVEGLRAYIHIEKKTRGSVTRSYLVPCFYVSDRESGKSDKCYRTNQGYRKAYVGAVKKYVEIHNLNPQQHLALISRLPDRTLFTDILLKEARGRGHKIKKKDLLSKLE